ncbi:MAG: DUF1634 domain-containing protein [Sulfolobales archaeon]
MDLEKLLSLILIIGVIVGIILLVIGLTLYIYSHGVSIDLTTTIAFYDVVEWILSLHTLELSRRIISIGLIIILLTPYTRAIASLIWFAYHRDLKFVLFTTLVAVILTLSIIGVLRIF